MNFTQILLYPFTLLYGLITDFRNHLYNIGQRPAIKFDTNVINVGNLTVGGTGKTPHVEYLIRLLGKHYQVATLSRGYGRDSKGFILADAQATAATIGDEPMQFYKKYGAQAVVSVGEERALAIPYILTEHPEVQVILLDDAYQHRAVTPSFNILLTDYQRLFYMDHPFPAGRLRERRRGAKRADVVIVSKCPDNLAAAKQVEIRANIKKYTTPNVAVFFTGIRYQTPQPIFASPPLGDSLPKNAVLVSGIAQGDLLEQHVSQHFNLASHIRFRDHKNYTKADAERVKKAFESVSSHDTILLTTEKDFVKLGAKTFEHILGDLPFYYIPIEIYFLNQQSVFDQLVKEVIV
ncbi:tetraacyldisaccharide 4'-kinase [uncultured Microscilla sp.]|uniref:tetraacyldisaccharide 4'-kinase n=1 Tax=uncultured Microscilla sp. TaxID=432653 RepID=UPI0026150CC5|nr:tetraacyldisaccharide 4'-kinase [uncultured Microscilla sp.]